MDAGLGSRVDERRDSFQNCDRTYGTVHHGRTDLPLFTRAGYPMNRPGLCTAVLDIRRRPGRAPLILARVEDFDNAGITI
jgi:hypothetical protein